jgi:hypothetical protein
LINGRKVTRDWFWILADVGRCRDTRFKDSAKGGMRESREFLVETTAWEDGKREG